MEEKKKKQGPVLFSNEKKQELVMALRERFEKTKAPLKCPMCQNDHFTIADAYLRNDLQTEVGKLNLGGPSIPAIAIICSNCGFISQHALGFLNLLPKDGEGENNE